MALHEVSGRKDMDVECNLLEEKGETCKALKAWMVGTSNVTPDAVIAAGPSYS